MNTSANQSTLHATKTRLVEIDRATAIAITLVVIGHIVARQPPQNNEWYVLLKYFIYKFHMPFFMFISGTIFKHTYKEISTIHNYLEWAKTKFLRLGPGFILFGSIIIFGKLVASQFMYVDNVQSDILNSYYKLLVTPIYSPGGSLWYIYALFLLYLIAPVFISLTNRNFNLILIISFVLHVINDYHPFPIYFMFDAICEYLFWFMLGAALHRYHKFILGSVNKYMFFFVLLFLLSLFTVRYMPENFSKTIISFTAIPMLLSFTTIVPKSFSGALSLIASYTYTIYLMNTLAIGFTKGVLLKVFPWDNANFFIYFFILFGVGLIGPILVHKYVFSHINYLAKITR